MIWTNDDYLLALANFVLCVPIVGICACRISIMSSKGTKLMTRVTYATLIMASLASALQPLLFGEVPGKSDLLVNFALLQLLISGRALWGNVPEHYKKPVEIDERHHVHIVGGKGGS